jgi:hypothetical protein
MVVRGLPGRTTIQRLANLLGTLEKRAHVKNLSVDDAFLIAAELESSEINDVFSGLIKPVQGTWYNMRKKVETLLSDHMQTLVRAARKFGASPPTLARLVEIKRREAAKAG